jgi:hypothetical protein
MKDEERAHRDAHFQEKLDSLNSIWLALPAYSSRRLRISLVKALLIGLQPLPKLMLQSNLKKG